MPARRAPDRLACFAHSSSVRSVAFLRRTFTGGSSAHEYHVHGWWNEMVTIHHPAVFRPPLRPHKLSFHMATEVGLEPTSRSSRPTVFKTAPRTYWGQLRHIGRGGGSRTHSARKQRFYRPPQLSDSGAPLYIYISTWCGQRGLNPRPPD